MIYRVTKRYGRGTESLAGSFKSIAEAKAFIEKAIENDLQLKINAIYSIYEGADLLEEIDSSQMEKKSFTESDEPSSQSQGAGQRFSPSPLSTKPQPGGMPQSSWKNVDTEDADKDKK